MKNTELYGLKKPELNDYVNVEDLNDNADTLDNVLNEARNEAFDFDSLSITLGANITITKTSTGYKEVMKKGTTTIATRTTTFNSNGTITQTIVASDYNVARRVTYTQVGTGYNVEVV